MREELLLKVIERVELRKKDPNGIKVQPGVTLEKNIFISYSRVD